MNKMKYLFITLLLFQTSCSAIVIKLTPDEIKRHVVIASAVAHIAIEDPPSQEHLMDFIKTNAKAWRALEDFYQLRNKK
jgi:hypothetical protein